MVQQLIIDSREDEKIIKLIQKAEIPYVVQKLECGDYSLGNIIFERKTIGDFYNSTTSGHLSKQLFNAKSNNFDYFIIILIGDYEDLYWGGTHANQNVFYGMLASIISKYKFSILHFKRDSQFVNFLSRCIDKLDGEIDFTKIKRLSNKDNVELSILCALPNISRERAERILEKYDIKLSLTQKNGEVALVDDLIEIDGIGNKIIENIKNYFE